MVVTCRSNAITILLVSLGCFFWILPAQVHGQTTGQLTVYASGPYEVWGGSTRAPGGSTDYSHYRYYYNIDLQEGYVKLGEATDTQSFPGGYKYYVVATHSLFHLDAIQLPGGEYIADESFHPGEYLTWGNVHRPWRFNGPPESCDLIGSPADYTHDNYIYGLPDDRTDDVGHPPGCGTTLERYEGFVAAEATAPTAILIYKTAVTRTSFELQGGEWQAQSKTERGYAVVAVNYVDNTITQAAGIHYWTDNGGKRYEQNPEDLELVRIPYGGKVQWVLVGKRVEFDGDDITDISFGMLAGRAGRRSVGMRSSREVAASLSGYSLSDGLNAADVDRDIELTSKIKFTFYPSWTRWANGTDEDEGNQDFELITQKIGEYLAGKGYTEQSE
jgi:hypothetical protein